MDVPFLNLKRVFALLFAVGIVCVLVLFYTADYFYYPDQVALDMMQATRAPRSETVKTLMVNPTKLMKFQPNNFETIETRQRENQLEILHNSDETPQDGEVMRRRHRQNGEINRRQDGEMKGSQYIKIKRRQNIEIKRNQDNEITRRQDIQINSPQDIETMSRQDNELKKEYNIGKKNVDSPFTTGVEKFLTKNLTRPLMGLHRTMSKFLSEDIHHVHEPSSWKERTEERTKKEQKIVPLETSKLDRKRPLTFKAIPAGLFKVVKPTPRPRSCQGCMQHNFRILIEPKACDPWKPPHTVFVIISSPKNIDERDAIRESWGKSKLFNVKVVFLFGAPKDPSYNDKLEAESNTHRDILQENFLDSYGNLTYKTMMAFKWVKIHCANAKYVFKTDDDMWVNVAAFNQKVKTINMDNKVGGMCLLNAAPIRDTRSKWYASVLQYPEAKYPGFCTGTAYFMTATTAIKLFETSRNVPFFYLEDIYVSLCADKADVKLQPVDGFHNWRVAPGDWCRYKRELITSHGISANELRMLARKSC